MNIKEKTMRNFIERITTKKEGKKYAGTTELKFTLEESIYIIQLISTMNDEICTFELNSLNDIMFGKFQKAYTVNQYKEMCEIKMIITGISEIIIHPISCDYKEGKVSFRKGSYFPLCLCLIKQEKKKKNLEEVSVNEKGE